MSHRSSMRGRGRIAVLATALFTACGGGADLPYLPAVTCSTAEERLWLADYFDDWYFWREQAPDPSPLADRTLAAFFQASLYTGTDLRWPRDRWSRMEPAADFDRFFEEGRTLGYGLFVAGLEVSGQSGRPLLVRYVEPRSDAAARGVRRGDEIVSANGRLAAQMVVSGDFGVLTPEREGDTLALVLRRDGVERNVSLEARAYELTPVSGNTVVQSPEGRRIGYLVVKDMISQAENPLDRAFADFKAAGVQDLVVDLRYNGGGLVSVATTLASYVGGSRTRGEAFARLRYNDRRADRENETFPFNDPRGSLSLSRVYLLTGPRTCSASELVINGLRPFVQVVTVGGTTCGKPLGFRPVERCDTTFSVVNFETTNARDEGRYFDGFDASCEVADDLSRPLGAPDEALLDSARRHADSGRCPAPRVSAERRRPLQAQEGRGAEPAERQGMWAR